MIDIKQAEIPIDDTITVLRRHVQGGDVYNSMMSVGWLAELIDRHRQICKNEIEGLKGDVKSAEAAYDACNAASGDLARQIAFLAADRDDWKADAAASETKLEKALVERDEARTQLEEEKRFSKAMCERGDKHVTKIVELKKFIDRLQGRFSMREYMMPGLLYPAPPNDDCTALPGKPEELNNGKALYAGHGIDPGATEGDKTVISFECCNVKHTFSPPKLGSWRHEAECHECGSKTTFGMV